ncbi:MAG: hypothetical protein WCR06_10570 [bacterium]
MRVLTCIVLMGATALHGAKVALPAAPYITARPTVTAGLSGISAVAVATVPITTASGAGSVACLPLAAIPAAPRGIEEKVAYDAIGAALPGAAASGSLLERVRPGEQRAPLSLWRALKFPVRSEDASLWDTELRNFDEGTDLKLEAFADSIAIKAVAINDPLVESVAKDPVLRDKVRRRLLEHAAQGYNTVVIPYRICWGSGAVVEMARWATNHFARVIIAVVPFPPWPSPTQVRADLDAILPCCTTVISGWGVSIDLACAWRAETLDNPSARTVTYFNRWLEQEAANRGKHVLGFAYDNVHGHPGANYRNAPEGLSGYLVGHLQPTDVGSMALSQTALSNRLAQLPKGKAILLGPFIDIRSTRRFIDRRIAIYASYGYGTVKMLMGAQ